MQISHHNGFNGFNLKQRSSPERCRFASIPCDKLLQVPRLRRDSDLAWLTPSNPCLVRSVIVPSNQASSKRLQGNDWKNIRFIVVALSTLECILNVYAALMKICRIKQHHHSSQGHSLANTAIAANTMN